MSSTPRRSAARPGGRVPYRRLVDTLAGLVRRTVELPLEPGDPRVFCFVAEAADTSRHFAGATRCARYGCGVALTREHARRAAIGEIVERYCAAFHDRRLLRVGAYDTLDAPAVDPERIALFSGPQHAAASPQSDGLGSFRPWPYAPFSRGTRAAWVAGWRLGAQEVALVPAALVYFPYWYGADEPYVADSASTGLSAGRTLASAVLGGLCEVVERDALAVLWYNQLVRPRVRLDLDDHLGRVYRHRFASPGLEFHIVDATSDLGIPTMLACCVDPRGGTAVGAATHLDPTTAAIKALLEAAQARVALKREGVVGAPTRYATDFGDVREFTDHARAYSWPEPRRHVEFLWSSAVARPIAESGVSPTSAAPPAMVSDCLGRLADAGLEAIAVDLTTADVAALGYHVVRVVVPGAVPLGARHAAPLLGGRRLREVPGRLGHAPRLGAPPAAPFPFP